MDTGYSFGSYDGVDAYVKVVEFVKEYNEKKVKDTSLDEHHAKVAQTI